MIDESEIMDCALAQIRAPVAARFDFVNNHNLDAV